MPETPEGQEALLPIPPPTEEEREARELQRELVPRLSEKDEKDLANDILTDHKDGLQDRQTWESNLAMWEDQYLGNLPDKVWPWPGCSNMHVPLTMVGIETLKPRLAESVLGGEPMIMAIPTEAMDEERKDRVEQLLNWQAHNRVELNVEPLVEESAHRFLTPGLAVAKIFWRTEQRTDKSIRSFSPETPFQQVLDVIFGPRAPEDLQQTDTMEWEGVYKDPGGRQRKIRVKIRVYPQEIQALIEREEIVYDSARIELLDEMDLVVPFQGGSDIQRLPFVHQVLHLSEDDLRRKVQAGRFDRDRVDELLNLDATGPMADDQGEEVRQVRASSEGTELDGASSVRETEYDIIESYRRRDIDDDGFDEEIVVWVSDKLPDKILGWDYLVNVYGHGRRPFAVGRYLWLPGRFYGLSFPEVIRGLQEEANTIHNQRVDAGTIQNTPMYFFRASSSHESRTRPLAPGEGVPIDNPQTDVLIPTWNGSTVWGQNEEALLYQYFERLTGLTDLALGRQPNRVGATRTATGVASLLSEAGLRFKTAMKAFQRFWVEIFEHVHALNEQYLPAGKEFRVTGRFPELIKIADRSAIRGRFDLRLSATTETLNRQVMREDATIKLQTAMNPILLQTGLVDVHSIARLATQFMRAYGETDPTLVIKTPRQEMIYTPEQELAMFLAGQDVEPSMMEDIGAHLQTHYAQEQSPQVREQLGPEGTAKLRLHIAKTYRNAQMQAVVQQMQASAGPKGPNGPAIGGEQMMNAQTGKNVGMQPAAHGAGTMGMA